VTLLLLLDSQAHYRKGPTAHPPVPSGRRKFKNEFMDIFIEVEAFKPETITTEIKTEVLRRQGMEIPIEQRVEIPMSFSSSIDVIVPTSGTVELDTQVEITSSVSLEIRADVLKRDVVNIDIFSETDTDIGLIYEAYKLGKINKIRKLKGLRRN
jgi:hypothetical protein